MRTGRSALTLHGGTMAVLFTGSVATVSVASGIAGVQDASVLGPSTLIPLGALIAGIGITVALTWKVARWTIEGDQLRRRVDRIAERVARLEGRDEEEDGRDERPPRKRKSAGT